MKNHFELYSNCMLTKGYNRSIIMDLQRETSELIPNDMYEVLSLMAKKKMPVIELRAYYDEENYDIILEYLQFLSEKEFGFFCDPFDQAHLPPLNTQYVSPEAINNAIIELNQSNFSSLENYLTQLDEVGCKQLTLFLIDPLSEAEMVTLLHLTNQTCLISFEVIMPFSDTQFTALIQCVNQTQNKLITLILHGFPKDNSTTYPALLNVELVTIESGLEGFKQCGKINMKDFSTNQQKVLESLNFNSCLHKKIAINTSGEVKNCPAMVTILGNTANTTIRELLKDPTTSANWNIKKDDILVCRDCEFRHICTDCRAFIENPDDPFSKPLKCGYSPYTNQWSEWSDNPLKTKAIQHYELSIRD